MDITNFIKQQGQFLKAEDVDKSLSKVFKITEEAVSVYNEKYNTDRLHIPGKLDDNDYVFDCSKTNARTIAEMLGNDTKGWVGKTLILETYKTKTSEGKMVLAINVVKVTIEPEKVS